MRREVVFLVVFYMFVLIGAEALVNDHDVELENFKKAVRHKRSTSDIQTLVKCSVPLAHENDGMTENEKAKKLGVCLARDAIKKASTGKDNASDMVRRIQQLYTDKKSSLVRRGWWSDAVGWVKRHAKLIWNGIQIAIKIIKAVGKK